MTIAVFVEPATHKRASSLVHIGETFSLAIHGIDIASNLCELITKLVAANFEAAWIALRNRYGSLEMGLLMNTLHHGTRL